MMSRCHSAVALYEPRIGQWAESSGQLVLTFLGGVADVNPSYVGGVYIPIVRISRYSVENVQVS